ncbi:MAG: L-seryl-tRNA(Sec) selenium transferase [Acidimicrobiales bacterium]
MPWPVPCDVGPPASLLVDAARRAVAEAGDDGPDAVHQRARELAEARRRGLLQPVLNATGVLLHTNLGRAPYPFAHHGGYHNVELRLDSGGRGNRSEHAASLLARACGAEAALVVNNCAAALLLTLTALGGPGRAAVASRGELVEIGGGFRVPEVMTASGTELLEVGTTNRTRRSDFERAVQQGGDRVALLLKVHQSNYRIVGFTESIEVRDLVGLGRPVVADIGSGLLDAGCPWLTGGPPPWLAGEPAARQTLAEGADLVTFSGDKLLGGPQAGIIAGRADLVATIARHPLARALRCGGMVLAALQQLALDYLDRRGDAIPLWRMATIPVDALRERAEALVAAVHGGDGAHRDGGGAPLDLRATAMAAVPGGGTLPGVTIDSYGVTVAGDRREALRRCEPPIIARVDEGRTWLDLRTVEAADNANLVAALRALAAPAPDPTA